MIKNTIYFLLDCITKNNNLVKNFTPKDTNFRPNTYDSIDFYQKYSISKEDIPILEETLKIYDECETIYKLITTPIDDFCVSNNSEDNPEDNQLNIWVYFDYSYRNWEFSISSWDVDKLAHKYKEAENFRLKPGVIVYSLNSEEKNINIDDLINDDYIIIKGTYVRIDYSNNNKYAFYVKIRSKTTWKEYITYSI